MITGGQIGDDKFLFFISAAATGELSLLMRVTCELHATGLTLPFDFTSVPHKSGKATALLVDYPSNSQMPSNDYLAVSEVQQSWTPLPSQTSSCGIYTEI